MTFIELLQEKCKEKNIAPSKMLENTGINPNLYSKWKARNTIPAADTVYKLAEALGCRIEDLLGMPRL